MGESGGLDFERVREGDVLPELRVSMDRETYFEYNRLVNELNPLHFDAGYARGLGFRDIVVAGVYTFSFIPRMIEEWAGERGRIREIKIKYESPVYIEETIIHKARVKTKTGQAGSGSIGCEVSVEDAGGRLLTSAMVVVEFS